MSSSDTKDLFSEAREMVSQADSRKRLGKSFDTQDLEEAIESLFERITGDNVDSWKGVMRNRASKGYTDMYLFKWGMNDYQNKYSITSLIKGDKYYALLCEPWSTVKSLVERLREHYSSEGGGKCSIECGFDDRDDQWAISLCWGEHFVYRPQKPRSTPNGSTNRGSSSEEVQEIRAKPKQQVKPRLKNTQSSSNESGQGGQITTISVATPKPSDAPKAKGKMQIPTTNRFVDNDDKFLD